MYNYGLPRLFVSCEPLSGENMLIKSTIDQLQTMLRVDSSSYKQATSDHEVSQMVARRLAQLGDEFDAFSTSTSTNIANGTLGSHDNFNPSSITTYHHSHTRMNRFLLLSGSCIVGYILFRSAACRISAVH